MTAQLIDGKAVAAEVQTRVRIAVESRSAAGKRAPALATVLVGADPASEMPAIVLTLGGRLRAQSVRGDRRDKVVRPAGKRRSCRKKRESANRSPFSISAPAIPDS